MADKNEMKRRLQGVENDPQGSKGKKIYNPPTYTVVPSRETLREQYMLFQSTHGKAERKVGITMQEPSSRYTKTQLYHVLTEETFFAHAPSHAVARAVEKSMVGILREFEDYFEHHDTAGGMNDRDKQERHLIYLAVPKSNADKCPACELVWLCSKDERQAHLDADHPDLVWAYRQLGELQIKYHLDKLSKYCNWPSQAVDTSSNGPSTSKRAKN